MKKLISFATVVASLLSFSSCIEQDDVLAYSQTEICTVVDGRLLSDGGYYLNITQNQIPNAKPVTSFSRVVIYCDVLNKTEGKTDEFDINLIDAVEVKIDNVIRKSTADEEKLGDDAAGIHSAWFSKDFLNIDASYTAFASSTVKHDISLVLDDIKSNSDTVYLALRHNAHGESYDKTTLVSGVEVVGEYFSYPVGQVIPAGTESIVVSFTWDWFKSINGTLTKDREITEGCLTWTK